MFKPLAVSSLLIIPTLLSTIAPAAADHRRSKRWIEPQVFSTYYKDDAYDPRFDGRNFEDSAEEVILIPRRKQVAREDLMDDAQETFVVQRPKHVKPKSPTKTATKPTPKSKPVQVAALAKLNVKPVKKSPIATVAVAKPIVKSATKPDVIVTKTQATSPTKQARLALPVEDRPSIVVAPKSARMVPASPIAVKTITCEKANEIVTGYGFSSVSPMLCVGKIYRFKALRDGKSFEINLSAASGELTEVKKL